MTCPNCGSQEPPLRVERKYEGGTRILFFNCAECDFSTWDAEEFKWTDERREDV